MYEQTQQGKLLKAEQVGSILGCGKRSIFRYRSAGAIPKPVKFQGMVRWRASDIEKFVACDCNMVRFNAERRGTK